MKKEQYPTEIIVLPSKGWFYDIDNPLSEGKLEMKLPTAKHEDILTSRNLVNKGIVVDEFIKSLITTPNINYDDILLGDKNGLLISSRILLYGQNYNTSVKCPSCGITNTKTFDISDFEIKELDFDNLPKGTNEFSFKLPYSKSELKFKFLNHKDETNIENQLKKIKKHSLGNAVSPEITTRLSYVITSYDGETSQAEIFRKISNEMPSRDSIEFRSHLLKVTPGLDTDIQFICEECGHEQIIDLPMNVSFFWPTGRL